MVHEPWGLEAAAKDLELRVTGSIKTACYWPYIRVAKAD